MKKKTMMCIAAVMCLCSSMTVYAAPETMPDGTVFDAEYYAQTYPDVAAVFGTDKDALYSHYATYGKAEGRSAVNPLTTPTVTDTAAATDADDKFDAVYYLLNNLDVLASIGSEYNALYEHYVTSGKAEGRLGCSPTPVPVYTPQIFVDEIGTIYQTDENGTLYITDSGGWKHKYDLDTLNTFTLSENHLMRYGWTYSTESYIMEQFKNK